jgi:VanZ family protein
VNPVRWRYDGLRPWHLWWPVLGYMAAIFGTSSLSNVPSPPAGLTDKHVHLLLYAGLTAVTLRALAHGSWRRLTLGASAGAALIATAYGVLDECHQLFVPGRSFEVLDMVANGIGALLASAALWTWGIIRPRNPPGGPHAL